MKREDDTMRVLVSQMGGCASMETREIEIAVTEWLICEHDINVCAFMELNFNWTKVNSLSNLPSSFQDKEKRKRGTLHFRSQHKGIQQCIWQTSARRN